MDRRGKFLLTTAILACVFVSSISNSLMVIARQDMSDLMGVTFGEASYDIVVFSTGNIIGSTSAAILFPRLNRQVGLMIAVSGSGCMFLLLPFVRHLVPYLVIQWMRGMTAVLTDIVTSAWLLEVWQEDVPPYMQAMMFSSSIGYVVGPLILTPFLSPSSNSTTSLVDLNATSAASHLVVPFSIVGSGLLMVAVMLLVLSFCVPYSDPKRRLAPKERDGECVQAASGVRQVVFQRRIIGIACCLFCFYVGLEVLTFNFVTEFSIRIGVGVSKSDAAILTSVVSAAFAVSRCGSIFLACKMCVETMIYASLVTIAIGNLLLLLFSRSSVIMLWAGVVLVGSGHASMYPSLWSFLEQRVTVTTRVSALLHFMGTCSSVGLPILVSTYIQDHPLVLVYVNLCLLTFCLSSFALISHVDRLFKRLLNSNQ